jgi:phosphate-selective porin
MREVMTTLALLGLAVSAAAPACDAPASVADIPDGKTATRELMVAAQKAVVAYDAAVKAYSACLQGEQRFNTELREFKARNAGLGNSLCQGARPGGRCRTPRWRAAPMLLT